MKIKIISVGKVKQAFVLDGEAEYLPRLKSFAAIKFIEVGSRAELPEVQMKRSEAEAVIEKIEPADFVVVLDEAGKKFTSPEFSKTLQGQMNAGRSSFCFAIGGAYGWDESIREKADILLSLSPMTFTYQMTRLVLVEQIYRAMTLIKGIPYHK